MSGRFSLLLALRYLRMPTPRSRLLYLIPLVPLFQFWLLYVVDHVIRRQEPLVTIGAPWLGIATFAYPTAMLLGVLITCWFWWVTLFGGAQRRAGQRAALDRLVVGVQLLVSLLLAVVAGPLGVVALIVYAVKEKPRARLLRYGMPLSYLLIYLLGPLYLLAAARAPSLLSFHASAWAAIGTAEWGLAVATVLALVFVIVLRHLTIFATIATYAMFLGCAALVIVLSVMSGFEGDIKHKILGSHAHVVITRPDEAFTDWAARLPAVAKAEGVVAVTPVLSGEAMISSPANRSNVIVHGIDPSTIDAVTDLGAKVELGRLDSLAHPEKIRGAEEPRVGAPDDPGALALPRPPDEQERARRAPPGILVGRELAKSMRIYLGDDVSLVSPTGGIGPSGVVPKARPYRVAGIFFTGMFEYDSKFVYVTLPAAQKLFDQADEVTALEVKVPDADRTEPTVRALAAQLGAGYDVADWKSLNRSLFSALALEKIVMFVFLSFIILVAAFALVANGQMIATRKTAEIAILKSMGASDGTIAAAFFWLGAFLGGLGVLAGVLGGVAFALALSRWGYAMDPDVFYLTQLPVHLDVTEVLVVATAGLLVTILATLHPAWVAARLAPVEGLREGGR